jgi:hypothetical protein
MPSSNATVRRHPLPSPPTTIAVECHLFHHLISAALPLTITVATMGWNGLGVGGRMIT